MIQGTNYGKHFLKRYLSLANKKHNISPPAFPLKLLSWFCKPEYHPDIEGDLLELYYRRVAKIGPRRAGVHLFKDVILLLRPGIIRPLIPRNNLNSYGMYKSYFKIGWRNLLRNKGYSAINIGGLAVGMAVSMLIAFWVSDELSFNKYNPNYARIAQVMQNLTFNSETNTQPAIPIPLKGALEKSYGNDFEYLVLSSWTNEHILSSGETKISRTGNYMDVDAPKLLSLKMLSGTRDGLHDPASILLSESTAKALFGEKDPINALMKIDNRLDVKVTGVYADLPFNSELNGLAFVAPWSLYITSEPWIKYAMAQWGNNSFQLFVQLAPNADMSAVSNRIRKLIYDLGNENEKATKPEIFLHPMKDWHLRANWENGAQTGGRIQYVWLFGIVGIIVMLLACINFMNLSTARAEQRAREVGIRKAIGSVRHQLISQFFGESLLSVSLAFLLAIGLVLIAMPSFSMLAEKRITFPYDNIYFWLACGGFMALTVAMSGSYPALYLSSFKPVKVLRATFRAGRLASLPRQVLVVLQFSVSVVLIIATVVVFSQIQFTKNRPVGHEVNGILMIEMKSSGDFHGKYDLLRSELKNSGAVEEMAESSGPLSDIWSTSGGFNWQGMDPGVPHEFGTVWVTHEFGKTVGWEIEAGRDFSRDFPSDSSAIIINEAAADLMGLQNPVGQVIQWNDRDYTVIAVVKDFLLVPYRAGFQTVYFNNYDIVNWMELRLNPKLSPGEALTKIEEVFKKHLSNVPFDYKFADQEYERKFAMEERIGKLSGIFAILAIFISCLGLFGLASFIAEKRTKEIGIRKVVGASVFNLWRMLSRDFVVLVIISCSIAIPVSYAFMTHWLQNYEYHTHISWWMLAGAACGAIAITLLTVSYQAIKAALMNPVKSLRAE